MQIIPIVNRRIKKQLVRIYGCNWIDVAQYAYRNPLAYNNGYYYLIRNQLGRIARKLHRNKFRGIEAAPQQSNNPSPHGNLPGLVRYEQSWNAKDPYCAVRTRIRQNLTGTW